MFRKKQNPPTNPLLEGAIFGFLYLGGD